MFRVRLSLFRVEFTCSESSLVFSELSLLCSKLSLLCSGCFADCLLIARELRVEAEIVEPGGVEEGLVQS